MASAALADAITALSQGRAEDAVAMLEALADAGVIGSGVAFDRGLAYAMRAKGGAGVPGDLGRAAHGFEEALRHDPHDAEARAALDGVRREIARRATAGGRAVETSSPPTWRGVVTTAPADAWTVVALLGSLTLTVALALRPRVRQTARLWASAACVFGLIFLLGGGLLFGGSWYVRHRVREAVVVVPRVIAKPHGDASPPELLEGGRVDVLDEREGAMLVRDERGEGWVSREAVRMLPPMRP